MPTSFPLVLIKGAGDLASGVALRLHRCGFPVVMTETPQPLAVRRSVAFAQAVYDGACTVEGVSARRCTVGEAQAAIQAAAQATGQAQMAAAGGENTSSFIPVVVDPEAQSLAILQPSVLVDAIMAKRNTGTRLADARLVVALGPGFTVGCDCHAIIETNRGHDLGRVLWEGSAEPDTGTPGELPGVGGRASRVLRAPAAGHVTAMAEIGDHVQVGQVLAVVQGAGGATHNLAAPFAGVLRGIVHPSAPVTLGMKIGDVDPRARREHCFTVSDKALAIGGGVLEAILAAMLATNLVAAIEA